MPFNRILSLLFLSVLVLLTMGMVLTILQYVRFDLKIGFLAYKQPLVNNPFWITVFYMHVFTCFVCLIAGFTQFSPSILEQTPSTHRLMGKIYVYNVLFFNFPVGLILAIYANGGIWGKIAFSLLAILWFYFTLSSVNAIRKGNIALHKKQMIRSYALTLTALTLRLLKMIMSHYSNWSYNEVYIFDAWTALIINLSIGELIIYYRAYRSKVKLTTIK